MVTIWSKNLWTLELEILPEKTEIQGKSCGISLNEKGYSSGKFVLGFGDQAHRKKVNCSYLQVETKRNCSFNYVDEILPSWITFSNFSFRDVSIQPKVQRVLDIWDERNIFDSNIIEEYKYLYGM